MTPLGWARANLIYDTIRDRPKPGSPMESVLLLVWQMRQEIEYYAVRAVVQASIDPDEGKSTQDAWKSFTEQFYPYLMEQVKRGDRAAVEYLVKEVKKGPLRVIPLMPLVKSRMRKKIDGATNNDDLPDVRIGKGRTWGRRRQR